jgi:DNA modification methylase
MSAPPGPKGVAASRRRPTATSSFGVGRRESHDASDFYARFAPPELVDDESIVAPHDLVLDEPFIVGNAADMHQLPDNSVALVVTSPPYFVGKQYERDIERNEVPTSYADYLEMLEAVFSECKRVLEPGGRIAVNVANLGRKPYRSLSADVITILQDRLHLLLRGEVIWQKGKGSTGSCAWGTFRKPANPVLRDITERVVIASKGRFDRAVPQRQRELRGLPHAITTTSDEFMEATLDVWEIEAESAKRVGHPAPFPVELPERLIHLYTYENDLVLDPFMGSGSALVAAAKTRRRYVGYDLDPAYAALARERVEGVLERQLQQAVPSPEGPGNQAEHRAVSVTLPVHPDDFQARAALEGKAVQDLAAQRLEEAGFTILRRNHRLKGLGLTINFLAADATGGEWYFDVSGAFTSVRPGLMRTDTVWKSLGRAHVLANQEIGPLILLTSNLPRPGSDGDRALRNATRAAFFDAVEIFADDDFARLRAYAGGGYAGDGAGPLPGFWTDRDLE